MRLVNGALTRWPNLAEARRVRVALRAIPLLVDQAVNLAPVGANAARLRFIGKKIISPEHKTSVLTAVRARKLPESKF
ncbi:hypothetical protein SSBR45G_03960 [Bradyrhizobium sp. SSBR45G]|uniref:hypothetical protein n=1 Tax=unclassified Bradyrhizobium TaxID=2631580 RepID=UPI0023429333|nr:MULTISPECIES: hypothetical protein [unclassified Bradyrhizobium]GLH75488.1 hypothetical protein SSBR45G_03960 [Bradyrhizobium sp. SSBR45G]GLH82725.1 hypothetical protein SSBR45R_01850 [Bradyrhizobium sp. SSBR45R]